MNDIAVIISDQTLLTDITICKQALEDSVQKTLHAYFAFGRSLIAHREVYCEAVSESGYGWTKAMAEHTNLSTKSVNRVCQLAENLGDVEGVILDADLNLATLYKLAAPGANILRDEVVAELQDGNILTEAEIKKRELLARLEHDDPNVSTKQVAQYLRDDEITTEQAHSLMNVVQDTSIPNAVVHVIVSHKIVNKHLWPHLNTLHELDADKLQEIIVSGHISTPTTGEIAINEASVTDLMLFVREVEAERHLAWLENMEAFIEDKHDKQRAKHRASVRGNKAKLRATIDGLATVNEDNLFAIIFELPESET